MNKISVNENKTEAIIAAKGSEATTIIELPHSRASVANLLQNILDAMNSSDNYAESKLKYSSVVFIRSNSDHRKVLVKDIVYLEAARNYCDIHLANGKMMNVTMPMNEVHEFFDPILFKRVHRSFVVNLEHIACYMGNLITLENEKKITIGREYRAKMEQEFVCIGSRKRVRDSK